MTEALLLDPAHQRARRQRGLKRIFYAGREVLEISMLRGGAGSYPDAPSRRMATDLDGTIGGWRRSDGTTGLSEFGASAMDTMNDEGEGNWINFQNQQTLKYMILIFPELREIDGLFYSYTGVGVPGQYSTSGDTTNGIDGTYTQRIADVANWTVTAINYREQVTSLAVSNQRSTRLEIGGTGTSLADQYMISMHTYGEISAGETPDRLLWFDQAAALEFSKPRDYGDVARGSAEDYLVYLRNNSASLTASAVQITAQALTGAAGAWFTFDEGSGFQATLALASSIPNGSNSPNITIRRITPDAGALSLHAPRAFVAATWA